MCSELLLNTHEGVNEARAEFLDLLREGAESDRRLQIIADNVREMRLRLETARLGVVA